MVETVNTRTDEIYLTLRDWILSLRITPGSVFSESALAAELGSSKTPVREALLRLRREGLVHVQSRSGYTAAPITIKDSQDICELRTLLENESARLAISAPEFEQADLVAAATAIDERFARLDLVLTPDQGHRDQFAEWLRDDHQFHLMLARSSGNQRLVEALENALDHVTRLYFLRMSTRYGLAGLAHSHTDLLAAISKKDHGLARESATAIGESIQSALLDGILVSESVQFANAAGPGPAKNTFYLNNDRKA